jgi:hypothetical protein
MHMTRDAGFSLVEVIVATTLTMSLTGLVVSICAPGTTAAPVLPEAIDLQQRARVAADVLTQELSKAGAGLSSGPQLGPLVDSFAPIVPRRMGLSQPDTFGVARADAITIRYVPDSHAQSTVSAFAPGPSSVANIVQGPGCPAQASCGFSTGADAFVFDRLGQAETFTLQQVQGGVASMQRHDAAGFAFPAGASVAEAMSRTYYFDAAQRQLRVYDGYQTDSPVVDGVAGLSFSYFGDPNPPLAPQPPLGTLNCLYDSSGGLDPSLVTLPSAGRALEPLPLAMFTDGPWCGTGNARFDADLLRVREIRVALRLEAQSSFRAQGLMFAHAGSATAASRVLPDVQLTFDVTPRNLNLKR